jgi:phospholipid/cholesterol/gamma-HCH transport system ATP-binding protein
MISFKDIWVKFGRQDVLRGVDLRAAEGRITAIIGTSGSGKSTALRVMMGLLHPDQGQIYVDGEDVTDLTEREWLQVRRKMGMVFQNSALFDSLTVCQNVGFVPHFVERKPWRSVLPLAMEMLEEVGLAEHAHKMPGELSGGMRRRVALARSLIYRPKILLYDEPTTGLDPRMIQVVNELILEMNSKYGVTSVVVTHDLECVHEVADHVVLLENGEAVTVGEARQLLLSDDPSVQAFTSNWRRSIEEYAREFGGQ